MLILDKIVRGFFEASVVAFALIAILSTVSIVTISNEGMVAKASITDSTVISPAPEIEWHQIDDVMVPVEFVEFPPFYISARPNMLYIDQK